MRDGEVRRAVLGVAGQAGVLVQSVRRALHIQKETAVEVVQVVPGGPADQAGIQPGDVIFKLDDQSVATVEDLRRYLERKTAGTRVRVSYIRLGASGPQVNEVSATVQVAGRAR